MSQRYLLGIDVGTTTTKGSLITLDGRVIASHGVAHPLSTPRPGWAEEDAERDWWGDVVIICRALLSNRALDPRAISAVGISSLAPAMVPLDAAGQPLRPAILYGIDTRAQQEIADLMTKLAARGEAPAAPLVSQDIGPKLLWYQRHEPALWRRTRRILGAAGYVIYRLTDQAVMDTTCASGYRPFIEPSDWRWPAERCALIDLDPEWLPPIRQPWQLAGQISPAAAAVTGLAAGTPVSAGVMDIMAEFLGGGVADPGDCCITYGTTMCIMVVTGAPVSCPGIAGHFRWFNGQATLIGGMATSAALTRWFRDEFGAAELAAESGGGPNAYTALSAAAAQLPPGSDGLIALPYFAGERTPIQDPRARGLLLGLTLAHGRAHIYRALLEAVAYGANHHFELFRAAGVPISEAVAIGGGALSQTWTQIICDVANIRQRVAARSPGAPLGAAYLAAYATGLVSDWTTLRDHWLRFDRLDQPNPVAVEQYRDYYALYRTLYPATREAMHRLAELSERGRQRPT